MSSIASATSSSRTLTEPQLATIAVYGGTLWKPFIPSKDSPNYSFRLISYFDGKGACYFLTIDTLVKSKLCAQFLIDSPAKIYCEFPKIDIDCSPKNIGNITFHFVLSSNLNTFKNYCEVTGLLEGIGFIPKEQQDVEQSKQTQITYVHKRTQEGASDLVEFYKLVGEIHKIVQLHFTETRTVRCDKRLFKEFYLDKRDLSKTSMVLSNAPSPYPTAMEAATPC